MKGEIHFMAVNFEEAARIIAGRPVVEREVFRKMIPEIRARTFMITGLEDLKVGQAIRDAIAEIPRGSDWEKIKKQVVEQLTSPGGVPWLDEKAAKTRAEILMRHHGFQAYAAAHHEQMADQVEGFPYWQYLTMGDELVRDSHAKLHGLILPANHPFWKDHYPPWDWGCRCQVVPISEEEYGRTVKAGRVAGVMALTGIIAQDYHKKSRGWVLPEAAQKRLATSGRLDEGTGATVDVASPRMRALRDAKAGGQSAARAAYQWNPGDLRMSVSELHARYFKEGQESVFSRFYEAMQEATFRDSKGRKRSVWEWALAADVERAARDLLKKPATKSQEWLVVLDHKSAKILGEKTDKQADSVGCFKQAEKALFDDQKVTMIHNHIEAGIPSPQDLAVLFRLRHAIASIAVGDPDGKVHLVTPNKLRTKYRYDVVIDFLVKAMEKMVLQQMSEDEWAMIFERLQRRILQYEVK
jgi:SPP1 gp7 family putative phage head morphogenesis protein